MAGPADVIEPAPSRGDVGREADADDGGRSSDPPETEHLTAIAFESPLGRTVIEAGAFGLRSLRWYRDEAAPDHGPVEAPTPLLVEGRDQVLAYFDGRLRRFSLPLAPQGTRFQRLVWGFLNEIPFGFVLTYGELAALAGSVPRAMGRACAANPLPLIIPCHRVVAAAGMGGYSAAGGADSKRLLLGHEGAGNGPHRLGLLPGTGRRRAVGAAP